MMDSERLFSQADKRFQQLWINHKKAERAELLLRGLPLAVIKTETTRLETEISEIKAEVQPQ